ncbi:copper amine oxidase N-terminal domain-containing protein [Thermodesulfitimonas autotrophica]|uniref:copper amine oxidase N-terminal domain-containing protein n=1 Tax=Thermodesulfitimonas autotrophica TaxID=1894989 RepID=UPI000F50ECC7|nr:copper amine oxidase N-terminal domain-containing protein [Thermodesulfitimonas autotrophica]
MTFSSALATVEKKDGQTLGWIKVDVDSDTLAVSGWVYATVTLPTGVKYAKDPALGTLSNYATAPSGDPGNVERKTSSDTVLTVAYPLDTTKNTVVQFKFDATGESKVNIGTDAADNINVKVTVKIIGTDGLQVGSDYTADLKVGQVVTKEVTASAETAKALSEAKNDQKAAKITFTESAAASLVQNDEIYLELPSSYFQWSNTMLTTSGITYGAYGLKGTLSIDSTKKKLTLKVDSPSALADTIAVTPYINVMPGAPTGDVTVTITSSSTKVKTATLVIGNVGAPTVTLSTKDTVTEDLLLAKNGQLVDEVTVKANGSIAKDKSIVIAAPAGVKFNGTPSCSVAGSTVTPFDDNKKVWIILGNAADEIKITDIKVDVDETAALGDLKLSFSGDAGATGDVVVGKIVAPATATATAVEVVSGTNAQAAGDITVTETKPASMASANIKLTLPSGVKFSDEFKYKINNGDEQTTSNAKGQNYAEINLSLGGAVDTIKFYGIKYDVDSTFKGDVEVALSGAALSANYSGKTILRVVNAKAVSATKRDSSFVIGSTTYKVNGVEKTMDVAPYIKDGRTYMPVRFAALAAGVDESNIIWDGVKKTVTLIKGDRVVQMTIGSKTMLINGIAVTMDAAPEISSGRTMLPFRYVGQALGATVGWDEASKTVTMNVQ